MTLRSSSLYYIASERRLLSSGDLLGIIGGVQPGMLRKFADGKTESGFIYRWFFALFHQFPHPKVQRM
ncbi:MAG: hypothetical protein MR809_02640 [Rikenellaceae bacterium]|nr:hypothetical protein [Rikenellaceae bacterium]